MADWSPASRDTVFRTEVAKSRRLLDAVVPEKDFQRQVIELAELRRFRTYHTFDSRHSAAGFPDIVAVKGERMLAIELKAEAGRVTAEQQAWLDALALVPGVEVHVWKPGDMSSGLIEEVLR